MERKQVAGDWGPKKWGISGSLVRGSFGFISVAMTKDDKKKHLREERVDFSLQFQLIVHPIGEAKAMGAKSS